MPHAFPGDDVATSTLPPAGAAELASAPEVMSCDAFVGDPVVNRAGEELGVLAHVMLDLSSGRVAYVVLEHGGVMGLGGKLFAVPWQALRRDAKRGCFILDVAREALRLAPGFDPDHWPSKADPRWAAGAAEAAPRR
jgi:sporulation protein YlmC with PRC-barrel domain